MPPQVFVVDTSVLASGLITNASKSPVAGIVDAMLSGTLVYLLSPALLDEYRAVPLRQKLNRLHGLTEQEVDVLRSELVSNAIWREPGPAGAAPDPGAIYPDTGGLWAPLGSHPGSVLITGDRLLLDHPPERVSVISPRTYAERFSTGV